MTNISCASDVQSLIDLDEKDDINKATLILSYAWRYTIGAIISTLTDHCTSHKLNQTETYVWMCCLCINNSEFLISLAMAELKTRMSSQMCV